MKHAALQSEPPDPSLASMVAAHTRDWCAGVDCVDLSYSHVCLWGHIVHVVVAAVLVLDCNC